MTDASRGVPGAAPERDDHGAGQVTDVTLLEQIGERSADALAQLYDRFGRPAYSLARRICVDEALAEDVVQEAFLVVWRDPGRFDPARGSVSSWLLTLVHHRAVDAVRREATRRKRTVAPSADGEEWGIPAGPGADQAALGAVVAGKVRDALAELPAEQREAMALAYFGGYTQREVASLVGVPLGTVKSRMFAGAQKLRALLGPHVRVEGEGR
ncbi:sigma-70 family RNA polymerase sigma factor [Actinomycetospora chlora]|uniref:Sigma-70 family RNA polymerase sigma factor n=1 Tax=Actinomycetospora chlora TaxID=663608 RepID=A0ABP9AC14_9PSEU